MPAARGGAGGVPTGGSSWGGPVLFSPSSCGGIGLAVCNLARSHCPPLCSLPNRPYARFLWHLPLPSHEPSVYSPRFQPSPIGHPPATTVTHFVPVLLSHSSPLPVVFLKRTADGDAAEPAPGSASRTPPSTLPSSGRGTACPVLSPVTGPLRPGRPGGGGRDCLTPEPP